MAAGGAAVGAAMGRVPAEMSEYEYSLYKSSARAGGAAVDIALSRHSMMLANIWRNAS